MTDNPYERIHYLTRLLIISSVLFCAACVVILVLAVERKGLADDRDYANETLRKVLIRDDADALVRERRTQHLQTKMIRFRDDVEAAQGRISNLERANKVLAADLAAGKRRPKYVLVYHERVAQEATVWVKLPDGRQHAEVITAGSTFEIPNSGKPNLSVKLLAVR